jgi:hypothetical protein
MNLEINATHKEIKIVECFGEHGLSLTVLVHQAIE